MSRVRKYMIRTMNSVSPDDSIDKVIKNMYKSELSVLPVVDHQNIFIGTIYSNNILKNIIPESFGFIDSSRLFYEVNEAVENLKYVKDEKVEKYMSKNRDAVRESSNMKKIAEMMLENKESLLFVVNDKGYLRGFIERSQLLHYLLDEATEEEERK
ncbi:CBS domain-containing protein [Halanaerobium sp. Z-7514]|uniref:CBS domain-containing protein n=1 Tax=Halanaerobium polyolivorans TaxID=2886943 RepID=A0AAW4WUX1_9FIRM|nr:CBS domain-containing protein [Halanaerobium polyolivorans]MCC3144895.1 CBS domain-containing protein [Halanaerobium polyolivorans]